MSKRSEKGEVPEVLRTCVLCHPDGSIPDLVAKVDKAWKRGKTSEQIARHYGLPFVVVDTHVRRCLINKHRSRYQRLALVFDRLYRATELAADVYDASPNNWNAQSYQGFAHQLRGLQLDLDRIQNAGELTDELLEFAVDPLVLSLTQALVVESRILRDAIGPRLGEKEAMHQVTEFLNRVKDTYRTATEEARKRIRSILSARESNRARAVAAEPPRERKLQLVK
jgi:hypothetical protein